MSPRPSHRTPRPSYGPIADWAWDARHLLGIRNTDAVVEMLPASVNPASWRKVETGSSVGLDLWTEVGKLYARLAKEKGVVLPKQPAHPSAGGQDAPPSIQAQLTDLASQVRALAAHVSPDALGDLIAAAVRDGVREAVRDELVAAGLRPL